MKKDTYIVLVHNTSASFQQAVNQYLNEGYILYDKLHIINTQYVQQMILRDTCYNCNKYYCNKHLPI